MTNRVIFSHKSDEYSTPEDLFRQLDDEFHFNLDPCSTDENCKCDRHYTIAQDGLKCDWAGCTVFCNPPYSNVKEWVFKAYTEAKKPGTTVVMLIPSRTDTRWFHDYIYHQAEIRFIRGRLRFNGMTGNAPFPSMIVVFR